MRRFLINYRNIAEIPRNNTPRQLYVVCQNLEMEIQLRFVLDYQAVLVNVGPSLSHRAEFTEILFQFQFQTTARPIFCILRDVIRVIPVRS